MKAEVKVRNVTFGEGLPKICIPITDSNLEELVPSIEALKKAPYDFVEWRADFYQGIEDNEIRFKAMTFIREQLAETPVLFTIRTSTEGGKLEISTEDYIKLNCDVIKSGLVDLVDVELTRGDDTMKKIVTCANENEVKIVGSIHDNAATPSKDQIVHHLTQMQVLGADIAKCAVMPQSARDVMTLLDATLTMREQHPDTPVITMAMGKQGVISRVCGSIFGSSVTFGTAGRASAPGQLPADLLATFLVSLG